MLVFVLATGEESNLIMALMVAVISIVVRTQFLAVLTVKCNSESGKGYIFSL